jgi:hypothetical protein
MPARCRGLIRYEKNKIDKDNFKKIIKKTMWGNTVVIYSVLKKKTKKLNSHLTQ